MPLKECACLPKPLELLMREAAALLKKEKVSDAVMADAEAKSLELKSHLEGLEKLGVKVTPELLAQVESTAKPDSVRLFEDLDKYIDSCKCGESEQFEWRSFPYHEIGYRAPKTPKVSASGEACTLSAEEKNDIELRLKHIADKYIYSLRDPVFLAEMKNKYGEELITGSNVRHEIVTQGRISKDEMNEFYELAHKLDEGCGRKTGTTVRKYDTELLTERINLNLQRKGREEFFKKK